MMTIRPLYSKWLPFCISGVIVARTCITFTVFTFLQPISYLVLALCILSFVGLVYLWNKGMTYFGASVALFFSLLLIISVLNNADYKTVCYYCIEIGTLLLLFAYYKTRLGVVLKSLAFLFSVMIYANLAFMIIFPNWMFLAKDTFDSFLLGGNYNQIGCRLLCGIITNVLCCNYSRKWLVNTIGLCIISVATLALVGSMTSLTCVIAFIAISILPGRTLKKNAIVSFFSFYVLFQVFVCFSGEGLHNNELAVYIIRDVLNKDLTFTYRTSLWEISSNLFWKSPLWGYGQMDVDWMKSHMTSHAIGPHNLIYYILLEGGIILFLSFLTIFLFPLKRIANLIDRNVLALLAGLTTLLFMQTMEVYHFFFILYPLTLIYYYPELKRTWLRPKVENS